jgi:hypothetical protein
VPQREVVRRHGAEVLAHHERLHARERQHQRAAMAKFLDAPLAVLPWVWRACRGCPARRRRGRPRKPPRAPAAGRTARTRANPTRWRGTLPRPRPASGGATSTISPGSCDGTPPFPAHLRLEHKRMINSPASFGSNRTTGNNYAAEHPLTFADLSDVEVEPSDGEVGVLDLRRHRLRSLGRKGVGAFQLY